MYHTYRTERFIPIWQTPVSTSHNSTRGLSWIKKISYSVVHQNKRHHLKGSFDISYFLFGCSRAALRSGFAPATLGEKSLPSFVSAKKTEHLKEAGVVWDLNKLFHTLLEVGKRVVFFPRKHQRKKDGICSRQSRVARSLS